MGSIDGVGIQVEGGAWAVRLHGVIVATGCAWTMFDAYDQANAAASKYR